MKENPNRDMAMKNAYAFARVNNPSEAFYWVDRAMDFAWPTYRQIGYLNRCLKEAGSDYRFIGKQYLDPQKNRPVFKVAVVKKEQN